VRFASESRKALVLGGIAIAAAVIITSWWWWWSPAPETLTQRLFRECRETLAYTHPEWSGNYLDRMTKGCMDQRLLQAR